MMAFVFVALFSKQQMQPVIKQQVVPAIAPCFSVAGSGVAKLQLELDSTPKRATITLKRIEADQLADDVRTCVKETLSTLVLPPIGDGGHGELSYPFSYDFPRPDNHDLADFHKAQEAGWDQRWTDALEAAEHGLKLTSLDRDHRQTLIWIAGIAACHLDANVMAARYEALASPKSAATIRSVCQRQSVLSGSVKHSGPHA